MGIKGLWQLMLPIGRRISIETLEGQILAVDASIWLVQFLKAMRDPETGKVQPAAHLKGFFRRICRLRYHNIRPVFVFDGKTPEVKARELAARRRRREQFAHASQGTMQRMAKKLLQETLLKQKIKSDSSSATTSRAYASGFNPGDQETVVTTRSARTPHETSEHAEDFDRKPAATVDLTLDEEHGDAKSLAGDEPEINDWDDPGETERQQLLRLGLYDSDDSEGNDFDGDDDLDMSFLASLPPNKRKEAIENAKRKQRMRSRQESMPAAGDPLAFSQVQLSNFLKSSKLNKSIETTLAAAVKHDNKGGDLMASDRTTRLELTREDETSNNNPLPHKRALSKHRDNSSDSEEEPDWEPESTAKKPKFVIDDDSSTDDDTAVNQSAAKRPRPKGVVQTMLYINDSDEGECDNPSPVMGPTCSLKQDTQNPAIEVDSEGDENDSEGGFLKPSRVHHGAINVDSDSHEEEGGFIRQKDVASDAKASRVGHVLDLEQGARSTSSEVTRGTELDADKEENGRDINAVQELDDRLLAKALQEAEDAEAAKAISSVRNRELASTSAAPEEQADDASSVLGSDDDEDIHWEDGESPMCLEVDAKSSSTSDQTEPSSSEAGPKIDDAVYGWEEGRDGGENISNIEDEEFDSEPRGKRTKTNLPRDETTAALERAQATASNLADWAGRVFRRAMKEAGKSDATPLKKINMHAPNHTDEKQRRDDSEDYSGTVQPDETSHLKPRAQNQSPPIAISPHPSLPPVPVSHLKPPPRASLPASRTNINESEWTTDLEEAVRVSEENEKAWEKERNTRERDMDSVTDEMRQEVIQLLQLFGVPYIEAPAEAESQCAELERLGLVNGVVTEDSDIFVFGGQTVYKNIFEDQKYAEVYRAADAEREMGIGRNEMVALAMLLGGDYTEGVKGVGIVNAMEVLEAFDFSNGAQDGLCKFKAWLDGVDLPGGIDNNAAIVSTEVKAFHGKHKSARSRWIPPETFPAPQVLQAYLHPVVDTSTDRFTWGVPDVARLMVYCSQNIGWSAEETKQLLDPIAERSGLRQTRLDSFMRYEDSITFANVKSKRLREVLQKKNKDS